MQKLVSVLAAAILVCVGVLVWQGLGGTAPAQEKQPAPALQKWEYQILEARPTADNLNNLGAEGWEVVSHSTNGNSHWSILKRLKK